MKTFKDFRLDEESKDTEWTKTMSANDMKAHLESLKAKRLWNNIIKHKAYFDYHSAIPTGNITGFQHKIDDGIHNVRLASTGKKGEHLHVRGNNRGGIFSISHNKTENRDDGTKIHHLIKRYVD